MRKLFLCLLTAIFSLAPVCPLAAGKPEITLQLVYPDAYGNANFDQDQLIGWFKKANDAFEGALSTETSSASVAMLATLHKSEKPTFEIVVKPANRALEKRLGERAKGIPGLLSRHGDYSLIFYGSVNGACPGLKDECKALVSSPFEKSYSLLKKEDLRGKKELLQKWALEEVLPIFSESCLGAKKNFKGVRNFGEAIGKLPKDYDPLELTDRNPDYWRALMEMSLGNELVTTAKIFLHVGKGEFDVARRYLQTTRLFSSEEGGLAEFYLSDLAARFGVFYDDLDSRLEAGIKKFDSGDIPGSAKDYEAILLDYPGSSWAHHELLMTKVAGKKPLGEKESAEEWLKASKTIYACDPMYPFAFRATTGKEGYRLFLRMMVKELFKDKKNFKKDLLEYADTALDLEQYALAANIYWHVFPALSGKDSPKRDLMGYFLFCVNKLGNAKVLAYFKKDYSKDFKAIEAERDNIMKKHKAYTTFKVKE